MKKIRLKLLFFLFLSGITSLVYSQENNSISNKEFRKANQSKNIGVSLGMSFSNYRDFATSPLIYTGVPMYIGASYLQGNEFRETMLRLSYSKGKFDATVNNETSQSDAYFFDLYFGKLYRIDRISNEKWNFKAGGSFRMSIDFRANPNLGNNTVGMEMLSNLAGSAKITRDLSRTVSKDKKFLWIKYRVEPRKRKLSYLLNIGLLNSTYRNGYAYTGQDQILNQDDPFSNYTWNFFSGLQISSELDYTIYLKNKNALQFSYIWNAGKTGGDLDKFEIAHHTIGVTLLFNTNNK